MFNPRVHNTDNISRGRDKEFLYKADVEIKAVIFDLGNVLISFDHRIAARKIASFSEIPSQKIYDLFFDSEITGLFEEGKVSPIDFYLKIKEMLDLRLDYLRFSQIWNDIFFLTEDNLKVYHLAKGLRERYKVAVLSNINVLHYEYIKDKLLNFDVFHSVFTSFELKLRKPDPLIYEKTVGILGVSPEEVFYTDDRDDLIAGASKLGIKGCVFRNSERLKQDLSGYGVIEFSPEKSEK